MIEWAAALKGLIEAKFDSIIHLRIDRQGNVHKDRSSSKIAKNKKVTFKNTGNVNYFEFSGDITPEDVEKLRSVLMPAFDRGDILLLGEDSHKLLGDYKHFQLNPQTQALLGFFKGKLTDLDYRLLETGLYVAYLLEHDRPKAQQIKADVIKRYGDRGKNIINLATGNYFSTHIKPLYEAMSTQDSFDESDFRAEYEQIVEDLPFAIFIHNGISEDEILAELSQKAEKNTRYGVSEATIILNGFGGNADRLEEMLPELKRRYKRVAPTTAFIGEIKSLKVQVYYKEKQPDTATA